jgi:hypothetical protein
MLPSKGTNMHGNTSFDVSTMKIGPYLLADIGNEGEKNVGNPKSGIFHNIAQTTPHI